MQSVWHTGIEYFLQKGVTLSDSLLLKFLDCLARVHCGMINSAQDDKLAFCPWLQLGYGRWNGQKMQLQCWFHNNSIKVVFAFCRYQVWSGTIWQKWSEWEPRDSVIWYDQNGKKHCSLSICSIFGWLWQISRRAGLSIRMCTCELCNSLQQKRRGVICCSYYTASKPG